MAQSVAELVLYSQNIRKWSFFIKFGELRYKNVNNTFMIKRDFALKDSQSHTRLEHPVTGEDCGKSTPLKYLNYIPENIDDFECSFIELKQSHSTSMENIESFTFYKCFVSCDAATCTCKKGHFGESCQNGKIRLRK